MISHELRKYVSFKCHSCQGEAQVTVADERIERVDCLACVVMVELHDATLMYDTLIKRYSLQEARNISRRLLRDRGMGRILLTKVDDEFSDPEWPFILVIEGDA